MKTRTQKIKIGLGLTLTIFLALFTYNFSKVKKTKSPGFQTTSDYFQSISQSVRNIASEKIKSPTNALSTPELPTSMTQKYEMYSDIYTRSSQFDKDEDGIKKTISQFNAIIQYEKNESTQNRRLNLIIGVEPEKFDRFNEALKKFGKIATLNITKTDKTNEYRELNARKSSTEKSLQSLYELKSKSGNIQEYIDLNEKIRETEAELQALGVDLGYFDTENEFCTVRLSMQEETKPVVIQLFERIKIAFIQTLKQLFYLLAFLTLALASVFLCIVVAERSIDFYKKFKS